MRRSSWILLLAAVLLIPFVPIAAQRAGETLSVFVTNFPSTFDVRGQVEVKGPIRQAVLRSFNEVLVTPVDPTATTRLIQAGTIETDGFAAVVLSVAGLTKGEAKKGRVGAILAPDIKLAEDAFNEKGQFLFPLEVTALVGETSSPYFYSPQPKYAIGFSRYKIYLFNTTDKSVTVDLFAYLTNS